MGVRSDWIYVIVTVGRRKNSYRIRVRPPDRLKQNEFAYKMHIEVDEDDWMDRVKEVEIPIVQPPNLPKPDISIIVEKETPLKVLDRLGGK